MTDAMTKFIKRHPVLGIKEERILFQKIRKGDLAARNKIISHNLRFVLQMVDQYGRYGGVDKEDLFQQGCLGLIRACDLYDERRGHRFISYAVHWIKARVMLYCARNFCDVRMITTHEKRGMYYKNPGDFSMQREYKEGIKEGEFMDQDYTVEQAELKRIINILEKRLVDSNRKKGLWDRMKDDMPDTLQQIGDKTGISRQAVSCADQRLKERVRKTIEMDYPEIYSEYAA